MTIKETSNRLVRGLSVLSVWEAVFGPPALAGTWGRAAASNKDKKMPRRTLPGLIR
jgi:hypothetical protein